MRFSQDVFSVADAIESVFRFCVTGVDPLVRQYGLLLNINSHMLQAEMTLFSSTSDDISLEMLCGMPAVTAVLPPSPLPRRALVHVSLASLSILNKVLLCLMTVLCVQLYQ